MRTIYKYNPMQPITGSIEKFLHVDYQNGEVMVWAIVNDELPKKEFAVICSGTGWPIASFQDYDSYIGTVQSYEGYVWHYFAVEISKINREREEIRVDLEKALADPDILEIEEEEEEFYFDDEEEEEEDDDDLTEEELAKIVYQIFIGAQEAHS